MKRVGDIQLYSELSHVFDFYRLSVDNMNACFAYTDAVHMLAIAFARQWQACEQNQCVLVLPKMSGSNFPLLKRYSTNGKIKRSTDGRENQWLSWLRWSISSEIPIKVISKGQRSKKKKESEAKKIRPKSIGVDRKASWLIETKSAVGSRRRPGVHDANRLLVRFMPTLTRPYP